MNERESPLLLCSIAHYGQGGGCDERRWSSPELLSKEHKGYLRATFCFLSWRVKKFPTSPERVGFEPRGLSVRPSDDEPWVRSLGDHPWARRRERGRGSLNLIILR